MPDASAESAPEQPVPEQPTPEKPSPEQPASEQPASEQLAPEQPVTQQPVTEQPVIEQPVAEQPVAEQPMTEHPMTEQPVTEHPAPEQPVTEQPVTEQTAPAQLVAFATAVDWISGSDFARRSSRPHRLAVVLDSFASICIRKGKGEAYAVAIQLYEGYDGSAGGKLTLTIAGNSGVPPEVETHLKSVLGQLRMIAHSCHKSYKDNGTKHPLQYREQSPHSGEAIAASGRLVVDLKASLYRHSLEKFTSRIGKRYKAFEVFVGSHEEHKALHEDDAWKTLLNVQSMIEMIFEDVLPTNFEYDTLVSLLDTLSEDVRGVLKAETAITAWLNAVESKHISLGGVCISQLTRSQSAVEISFLSSAISRRWSPSMLSAPCLRNSRTPPAIVATSTTSRSKSEASRK